MQKDIFLGNIKRGSGKLLEAPSSITQEVVDVCNRYEVATKTLGRLQMPTLNTLLSIADTYVIAEAFRLRTRTDKGIVLPAVR